MPAKQNQITDEERAKRIREAARELETSDDPKDFDRAFDRVAKPNPDGALREPQNPKTKKPAK